MTVNDFIKTKVLPEYQDIAQEIRKIVHEFAPESKEEISYGIPVFRQKKIFAVISPNKKGITFSFTHGAEFEDKYNLLEGVGKVSRVLRFKNKNEIDKEALKYYIKQALEIDVK